MAAHLPCPAGWRTTRTAWLVDSVDVGSGPGRVAWSVSPLATHDSHDLPCLGMGFVVRGGMAVVVPGQYGGDALQDLRGFLEDIRLHVGVVCYFPCRARVQSTPRSNC
jgi:hypothetical protein